jgi:microcystin-dependent protein
MPIGMIVPYAGLTPPTGWLLCDGSEVPRTRYQALYEITKGLYGNSNPYNNVNGSPDYNPNGTKGYDTFKLPDLRGRFPLGADNMFNGITVPNREKLTEQITTIEQSAGRITDESGSIDYINPNEVRLGGGSEDVQLTKDNLPDHDHDLKGSNGGIYGAYSAEITTDADVRIPGPGGQAQTASLLRSSGGMINATNRYNQPFNIMNPYLALNYIIWTGKLTDFDE